MGNHAISNSIYQFVCWHPSTCLILKNHNFQGALKSKVRFMQTHVSFFSYHNLFLKTKALTNKKLITLHSTHQQMPTASHPERRQVLKLSLCGLAAGGRYDLLINSKNVLSCLQTPLLGNCYWGGILHTEMQGKWCLPFTKNNFFFMHHTKIFYFQVFHSNING